MRRLATGDKVTLSGRLHLIATVAAGPIEPLRTTPPCTLDTVLVTHRDGRLEEVWRTATILMQRAPDGPCAFCQDRPLPNAARWIQRNAPAETTCPRCGVKR